MAGRTLASVITTRVPMTALAYLNDGWCQVMIGCVVGSMDALSYLGPRLPRSAVGDEMVDRSFWWSDSGCSGSSEEEGPAAATNTCSAGTSAFSSTLPTLAPVLQATSRVPAAAWPSDKSRLRSHRCPLTRSSAGRARLGCPLDPR
jgi:hypothetical protein